MRKNLLWAAAAVIAAAGAQPARAEDGRMSMVVGYNPGGSYDFYARVVAKHMGAYLPGKPAIIVKNMPGVASIKAANYLYVQAPRDGSVIGEVTQTLAVDQRLKVNKNAHYDASKFNWIGRVASNVELSVVWHTSPAKTIEEAKKVEIVMGATSPRGTSVMFPTVLNRTAGTKLRMVTGYKGTTGALNAMERGEVQGSHTTWISLKTRHQAWLRDKTITILVQYGPSRHPDLPDVPTVVEAAKPGKDRAVAALVASSTDIGRSFLAPPEVPAGKVAALRAAFDKMMKDQKFASEVARFGGELLPLDGEGVEKLVAEALATPDDVAELAKKITALPGGKKKKKK